MKTVFDPAIHSQVLERFGKLKADSRPEWGEMSAAQMLAHCTAGIRVPLGELNVKWSPLRFIGWMFKGMVRNDQPFKKSSPTAPEFKIVDQREFEAEKQHFLDALTKISKGPSVITCHHSAFFGKMTDQDWGTLMYKHINHHFLQFGI